MASFYPTTGTWYQEQTTSLKFEVVGVDQKYGTIEVQYDDGDIAEYDQETWSKLDIIVTKAPNTDGLFETDDGLNYSDFENPLEDFEPDSFSGFDDLY